jgi:hypothetical protein
MKTRDILILVLGATAGVIADRLFSSDRLDYERLARALMDTPLKPDEYEDDDVWVARYTEPIDISHWQGEEVAEFKALRRRYTAAMVKMEQGEYAQVKAVSDSLADTQPIRVDEVGKGVEGCQK